MVMDRESALQSLQEQLAQTGLSHEESNLYLTCLKLGESTALELSRASRIKRPTPYLILSRLTERGVVLSRKLGHKKVFRALSLEIFLSEKKRALAVLEDQVRESALLLCSTSKFAEVRQLFGKRGLDSYYADCYAANTEIFSWIDQTLCSSIDTPQSWTEANFDSSKLAQRSKRSQRAQRRIDNKAWIRALIPYEPNLNKLKRLGLEHYQREFLHYKKFGKLGEYRDFVLVPRSQQSLPCEITIYGDNVAIVSYLNSSVTIVKDAGFASSLKTIFMLSLELARVQEKNLISERDHEFLAL